MPIRPFALVVGFLLICGGYAHSQAGSAQSGSDTPVQTPRHIRISGGVLDKNILSKVQPVYPKEARVGRISGNVVMIVTVNEKGTVDSVRAISGPEEIRQAAIDAVQQWVYKPYLLNGNPVSVDSTVNIAFNLTTD
jgi:protein TonB